MQTFSNAGTSQYLELPKRENAQVETISREELSYLAGIIDGEGCVGLYWDKTGKGYKVLRPLITINNNDVDLIKKVSEIYCRIGLKFWYQLKKRKNPKHQLTLIISVCGQGGCKKLLDTIYPYLIAKKKEADVMKKFIAIRQKKLATSLKNKHSVFQAKYDEREWECLNKIRTLKNKIINPQRLTRKASCPLEVG